MDGIRNGETSRVRHIPLNRTPPLIVESEQPTKSSNPTNAHHQRQVNRVISFMAGIFHLWLYYLMFAGEGLSTFAPGRRGKTGSWPLHGRTRAG